MIKDIVIAVLAAVACVEWGLLIGADIEIIFGLGTGIFALVFIFLLFLDDQADKRREKARSTRQMEQTLRNICSIRLSPRGQEDRHGELLSAEADGHAQGV